MNILRVDGSMRRTGSISRQLTDELIDHLRSEAPGARIHVRDLADPLPFVDKNWIGASFTDPDERTEAQKQSLAQSDGLVEELEAADTIVIGLPIYNFGVPAAVKAWIDLITRARRTFRYGEHGPEGLLSGKTAYLVVASGGVSAGAEVDYATPYLQFALGFVGIKDVKIIDASAHMQGLDEALARARSQIAA